MSEPTIHLELETMAHAPIADAGGLPVGRVADAEILQPSEPSEPECGVPPGRMTGDHTVLPRETRPAPPEWNQSPAARDRGSMLLIGTLLATVALGSIYLLHRGLETFVGLRAAHPLLGGSYLVALSTLFIALGLAAGRSWRRYQRLREVTGLQRLTAAVHSQGHPPAGEVRRELDGYLSELLQRTDRDTVAAINSLRVRWQRYGSDSQRDLEELETFVLAKLDARAADVIDRRAAQTAMGTALASHLFDPLIISWQAVRLVDEVSAIYAGRPGFWGTLRLLRRGMAMIVFAEVVELAAQATTDALIGRGFAELGTRAAEGMANGFLMLRLGEAVKRQCRPVPLRAPVAASKARLMGAVWQRSSAPVTS